MDRELPACVNTQLISSLCPDFSDMEMKGLSLKPALESMPVLAAFLEEELERLEFPLKKSMKLQIVLDEIYSNIIRYSGATRAEFACGIKDGGLWLIFCDDGRAYDPLAEEDPDVSLSAEERDIGGLGIFMVRKIMNKIEYAWRNGYNVLSMCMDMET